MLAASLSAATIAVALATAAAAAHDLVLRGGTIYDGSGDKPYVGDVAIDGDRITYMARHARWRAHRADVRSGGGAGIYQHARPSGESFLIDGRALSDLRRA
jgi:N-acyl-D-amino-acid deacylase